MTSTLNVNTLLPVNIHTGVAWSSLNSWEDTSKGDFITQKYITLSSLYCPTPCPWPDVWQAYGKRWFAELQYSVRTRTRTSPPYSVSLLRTKFLSFPFTELEYTAKLAKLASATKAAITEEVSPKSCSSLTETSLVLACSGNVLSRTDLCSNYHSVFIREGGRGIP